jgi:CubicO group peptidase (beta-lactamase class C family)
MQRKNRKPLWSSKRFLVNTVIVFGGLVTATTASGQQEWTVTGQEVPELAAVDLMMQEIMQENDIRGGSIAITKDGRLVYARGFTWDQPNAEPVQPTTLFRIGSIGKSITSIAIHQLIEKGLLAYDTMVAETLGLQPPPGRSTDPWLDSVTVDHLLTHTSGMYAHGFATVADVVVDTLGVEAPPTKSEIISFIISIPFFFEPGTSWDYNNFGYIMLGMLSEQLTGLDFPEYVFDNVLRPVGVSRARMAHTLRSDLAPNETTYDGLEGDPYATSAETGFAAGLIVMSAPDLARVYSSLFDHPDASGLLEQETVDAMLSTPFAAGEDLGYARGWIIEDFFVNSGHLAGALTDPDDGLEVYGHGGGGSGVHTLAMWRSDGITFVWFTNKDPVVPIIEFPEISSWPDHDLWSSVGISSNPAGSAPTESWIPAAAHTDGVEGSVWRSDVGLLNRSQMKNTVRLRYHRKSDPIDRELELAAGEARVITDVVDWFGTQGFAPLQVFSADALTVTSRTYNQSPEGTFGQSLDSVTATGGLESGESVVLMQLREDAVARTNIGILNQWRRSARVEVELHDHDGSLVTAFSRKIPAQETVQLNRPFFKLGDRDDVESGYAVITVRSGQDIHVYGSVIDNATGDPTAIPMKSGDGSPRQWIAAAAHGGGVHGSVWRTDVCLLNRSGWSTSVEVAFQREDGTSSSCSSNLEDGQQVVIGDVVAELGMSGSGAIQIASDRPLLATSRTYNAGSNGTFGLFLDGVPTHQGANSGDVVWLPQLRQNAAFRTNIGLTNSGNSEARIRIYLYDSYGTELVSRSKTLEPGAWTQLQEPFSRFASRTDIEVGAAKIEVVSGNGVIAYASVIDNATNDGTAIAMKR